MSKYGFDEMIDSDHTEAYYFAAVGPDHTVEADYVAEPETDGVAVCASALLMFARGSDMGKKEFVSEVIEEMNNADVNMVIGE